MKPVMHFINKWPSLYRLFYIALNYFRNRLAEMKKHLLPFNDHDTGKIADLGLLDHEIEYLARNVTLELPANLFRRRLEAGSGGRRIDCLQYVSFELRHTFPHNIALMNTGEIVYCTEFDTRSSDGQVIIQGHKFKMVSSEYFILYQNIRFRH